MAKLTLADCTEILAAGVEDGQGGWDVSSLATALKNIPYKSLMTVNITGGVTIFKTQLTAGKKYQISVECYKTLEELRNEYISYIDIWSPTDWPASIADPRNPTFRKQGLDSGPFIVPHDYVLNEADEWYEPPFWGGNRIEITATESGLYVVLLYQQTTIK